MSRREREKGRKAEADVRRIFTAAGFEVRGLEATGDHLVIGHGLTIHSEVKRQEVLRLPLWTRQAAGEAPRGALPIVIYRQSREPWRALLPSSWTEVRIGAGTAGAGLRLEQLLLNGEWWSRVPLDELLEAIAGVPAHSLEARAASRQEAL